MLVFASAIVNTPCTLYKILWQPVHTGMMSGERAGHPPGGYERPLAKMAFYVLTILNAVIYYKRICAYRCVTMKNLTRAAQAISDETRLRILNLVMEHECCVCEVMQALDISQTRASRNLKILYDAGFLNQRNDGLFTLYSLNGTNGHFYADLIEAARKGLAGSRVAQADLARLHEAKRVGPGCVGKEVKCSTC